MARTPSTMIDLETEAADFSLPDTVSGKEVSLSETKSDKANLVMFICNHCPFVLHVIEGISEYAKEYKDKGVNIIAISSNDVENYPQDSPEKMKEFAKKYDLDFPYLYDESQDVAKAYDAACTPDFFLYDGDLKLKYRGQFDDSRPENGIPVTGKDLRAATDALLEGKEPSDKQIPSIGCNIKWKNNG